MSENVIKFPTKAQQRLAMKKRLNTAIFNMDKYYDKIDAIMAEMCLLEDEVGKLEADYSQILREYAKISSMEDMETRFLSYCTDANVHWDGDTNSIIFRLPFEDDLMNDEEEEE